MQKKNILILFIIFINLSFSSLSKNDKVTRSENVEFRNGYYYIIGEKEPFTGIIEFQDESGKIMKGNFLNGIANGMAKTYSSDGRLLSETPYENGKKNGKQQWRLLNRTIVSFISMMKIKSIISLFSTFIFYNATNACNAILKIFKRYFLKWN